MKGQTAFASGYPSQPKQEHAFLTTRPSVRVTHAGAAAQVVMSLRSRHANLLQPRSAKNSNNVGGSSAGATPAGGGVSTRPSQEDINSSMPIRLITNGLWPVVAVEEQVGGGGGGGAASGTSGGVADGSGCAERRGLASPSAASVARQIAEVFDSVSVALNTADPAQYQEVSERARVGADESKSWPIKS